MAYPPAPAAQPAQPVQKQGNGFGVTALVLGIIGAVLAIIPAINIFTAIPLGILALIFGFIALGVSGKRGGKGKGTGGVGVILGIVALAGSIAINVWFVNEASDVLDEEWQQACDDAGLSDEECGEWEDWDQDVQ
ncbi:hypothetical protein [Glycomyces tarimensis]